MQKLSELSFLSKKKAAVTNLRKGSGVDTTVLKFDKKKT